jgi:hypothetical protein
MPYFSPDRALLMLRKTAYLLPDCVAEVTPEQARTIRDGADGWHVIEVLCHLRDLANVYERRAHAIVEQDKPQLPGMGMHQDQAAIEFKYIDQDMAAVLNDFQQTRARFITWLEQRPETDWKRSGFHPEQGEITLLEQAYSCALHDVNHIEQIVRSLREAG